jgi:prepilin-type N-terminal cleavage/methylation domain-containing protein
MTRAGTPAAFLRRVRAQQSGFTLIELLVVTGALTFVLAAILSLAETSEKLAPQDQERAHVIREAQIGLHRMTRELRQAHAINSSTGYSIDFNVGKTGSSKRVVYDCGQAHPTQSTWRRCLRWEVGAGGTTSPLEVIVDRVLNTQAGAGPAVFTYQVKDGRIVYATAHVEVPAKGDLQSGHKHRVVLDDGVYMRNFDD